MKLIAQMIAKNEADRYLDDVLAHLSTLVDEIVFTDDCSDDNTLEIASKYTDYVYKNDRSLFAEHEGLLRQTAWHNLENHAKPGDWCLAIDADEKLFSKTPTGIDPLLNNGHYEVIGIRFYHMWNENQYRIDKAWAPTISSRLFRYREDGKFLYKKLACGSEPTYVRDLIRRRKFMINSPLAMQHLGYLRDQDKRAKFERYMKLDGGDFHAKAHIESIIDPDPVLVNWSIHAK